MTRNDGFNAGGRCTYYRKVIFEFTRIVPQINVKRSGITSNRIVSNTFQLHQGHYC